MRNTDRLVGIAIAASLLTGCSSLHSLFSDRYGPEPVLLEANTTDATVREAKVVTQLMEASGFLGESKQWPKSNSEWYSVILTGFNVVDDACQTYIDDLWKFDRGKSRVKDLITASGAATAAIVGANANPSASTLTTLAQAFGLASAMTTAIGDSYLFAQDPATIGQIVKKTQVAYRNDLGNNIETKTYPISSPAAVYYHTREYLSLCLPPTIQAQVQELVAKAKASTNPPSAAAPVAKVTSTTQVAAVKQKATSSITLTSPAN